MIKKKQRFWQIKSRNLAKIRLPDSWFLVLITIFLAITTFWIDRFVSKITFWQETKTKQISLHLDDVVIEEYKNGYLVSMIESPQIIMKSKEGKKGKTKKNNSYEHWQFYNLYGINLPSVINKEKNNPAATNFYAFYAGKSLYEKKKEIMTISNGFQAVEINNQQLLTNNNLRTFQSDSGFFYRDKQQMQFNDKVAITDNNSTINGTKMNVDMQSGKIHIEKIYGILF